MKKAYLLPVSIQTCISIYNPYSSSNDTRHFPPSESMSISLPYERGRRERERGVTTFMLTFNKTREVFSPYKRLHKCLERLLRRPCSPYTTVHPL